MNEKTKTKTFWIIFSCALISLFFLQYYSLIAFRYLVPPGDDPMNHYTMAKYLTDHRFFEILKNGGYPPLYHFAIVYISRIFNVDVLKIILWTYPLWIMLAALAIFFCGMKLFGKWAGLISFLLYSFTANSNIQLQNDGGYPNLIATHIFLPLLLILIFLFFEEKRLWLKSVYGIFFLTVFILVVFTHHFTTLSLLTVSVLSGPAVITYLWIEQKWKFKKASVCVAAYLLIVSILLWLFFKTDLFASARTLAGFTAINFSAHFPFFELKNSGNGKPWPLSIYSGMIGTPLIWFGAAGTIILPLLYFKKPNRSFISIIILSIWAMFYYFASRQSTLSEPGRLARDLVVPLSISAGGILSYFLYLMKRINIFVALIFSLVFIIFFYPAFHSRIKNATEYNAMVRMTRSDIDAVNYLASQKGFSVLAFGFNIYLPVFLPTWNIGSYDSNTTADIINSYDYLYVIDKQVGWLPDGIQLGLPDKVRNDDNIYISLEKSFENPMSRVLIFKVNKPVVPASKPKKTKNLTPKKKTISKPIN